MLLAERLGPGFWLGSSLQLKVRPGPFSIIGSLKRMLILICKLIFPRVVVIIIVVVIFLIRCANRSTYKPCQGRASAVLTGPPAEVCDVLCPMCWAKLLRAL